MTRVRARARARAMAMAMARFNFGHPLGQGMSNGVLGLPLENDGDRCPMVCGIICLCEGITRTK